MWFKAKLNVNDFIFDANKWLVHTDISIHARDVNHNDNNESEIKPSDSTNVETNVSEKKSIHKHHTSSKATKSNR